MLVMGYAAHSPALLGTQLANSPSSHCTLAKKPVIIVFRYVSNFVQIIRTSRRHQVVRGRRSRGLAELWNRVGVATGSGKTRRGKGNP